MTKLLFLIAAALSSMAIAGAGFTDDPMQVELGTVEWGRDYAAAKKSSAETGKPLLLFFQEVPG
jgi:hypothetical protein